MSSARSVNETLQAYLAGQLTAEQVIAAVAAEYYRDRGNGTRDMWRPIMNVVERAHPGIVELAASQGSPGFHIRLAERPFPKRYEAQLRQAVGDVVATVPVSRASFPDESSPEPGLLRRLVDAIRRFFRG